MGAVSQGFHRISRCQHLFMLKQEQALKLFLYPLLSPFLTQDKQPVWLGVDFSSHLEMLASSWWDLLSLVPLGDKEVIIIALYLRNIELNESWLLNSKLESETWTPCGSHGINSPPSPYPKQLLGNNIPASLGMHGNGIKNKEANRLSLAPCHKKIHLYS